MTIPRLLSALALALLAIAPGAMARDAGGREGVTRHYDAQGRAIGRSETRHGTTRHYDAMGRFRGRTEWDGRGTARIYDAQGRLVGRQERR